MHFKYAKFDFSESILTPKNQSRLPKNDFLYAPLIISSTFIKTLFANFKFRGTTSFSEIMPNWLGIKSNHNLI